MRLALFFPGQGSQKPGMGDDFAAEYPAARAIRDRADAAYGGGLAALMSAGPPDQLILTRNAQPAILTLSAMVWELLRADLPHLEVACAAGHSLAEFSALVASGALQLEDAVPLVRDRGDFMQSAVPVGAGAMAACIAEQTAVAALVAAVVAEGAHGVLAMANFNGPGQVVISGTAAAVERAKALASEHGVRRVLPLDVSAPFHSPLMQPAQDRFGPRFAAVAIHDFAFPIVTNLEATPNADPTRVHDIGTRQITAPVRWTEICQYLIDAGCDTVIEVGGPGILTGMLTRGWKEAGVACYTTVDVPTYRATVDALR